LAINFYTLIEFFRKLLIPSVSGKAFIDGDFMTIYLSPGDYHRIHSPVDGMIIGFLYVPGRFLSVRGSIARMVSGIYIGNERVTTFIRTVKGNVAVCKVGAANVGAISLTYDSVLLRGFSRVPIEKAYLAAEEKPVRRGDEIGVFNLGSTVIVLFEKGMSRFSVDVSERQVQMGQGIAEYKGFTG
jgi:phosphatidylserine decarboxylase